MSKKKTDVDPDAPSFEASLAELEQIVGKLEGGKLPLAEALAAYEQGVKRLSGCFALLRDAERKIELVQSVDAAGRAVTEPFEDGDEEDLSDKSAARSRKRTAKAAGRGGSVDDRSGLF